MSSALPFGENLYSEPSNPKEKSVAADVNLAEATPHEEKNAATSRDILLGISAFIKALASSSGVADQPNIDLEQGYSISLNLKLGTSPFACC